MLSVNFRGSSGFGKAFLNAGNREWGGRMQDDLLDAVQWAVENGIAQPDRVAIMGNAYGGYAALAGLASTPEQFRCGASFGAPANLSAMLEALPPYATAYRDEMHLRVGDARTPEGRQLLRERSPLFRAGQITKPLLLAYGARDPIAVRAGADQIGLNLRGRRSPLVSLVYPDEGRELTRVSSRLSYLAVAEQFLGECLGGRVEPVGAAFEGANLQALDGAASVPGLSAFARRPAPAPTPEEAPVTPDGGAGGPDAAAPPQDAARTETPSALPAPTP